MVGDWGGGWEEGNEAEAVVARARARPRQVLDATPSHDRRVFAACVVSLDAAAGRLEAALRARAGGAMWARTVWVFSSDNGAQPLQADHEQGGSNWPLKGQKFTTYEGGTRVPCFIHSELLPAARRGLTCETGSRQRASPRERRS